jgi:molybdopterin molybdotransferase
MITVDRAREAILAQLGPLPPRAVALQEALGCTLAEDVVAQEPFPPFSNSAMDGYAVRAEDLAGEGNTTLRVVGELAAGSSPSRGVGPGQCIRIMTGAPLPSGADAVVMVEHSVRLGDAVELQGPVRPAQHVRREGEDITRGQRVLRRGDLLGAGAIGLLAGLGHGSVVVFPKPVVAILSTGDELLEPGQALAPGKIRDSNGPCLAALVTEAGAVPLPMGIARDREDELRAKIRGCLRADVVVTTGGVSVGDFDLVKKVLAELGEMLFWKVGQRPGKPLAFGMIGGKPLFGLPGNPGAAMVSFENFVRPTIGRLAKRPRPQRPSVDVVLGEAIETRAGFRSYLGVTLAREGGSLVAREAGLRSSGALWGMARADALLELPEEPCRFEVGSRARASLVRGDWFEALQPASGSVAVSAEALPGPALPVLSIVGKSNSGKTTLLTKMVAELTRRGRRVVTIKHDAHSFDIDHEGKDSWRHFQAGTRATLISSPEKLAMVRRVNGEWGLDALATLLGNDADIVITEGYRGAAKPKIEVLREARSARPICAPEELIALATDVDIRGPMPVYGIDDVAGLCDLVEERFLGGVL